MLAFMLHGNWDKRSSDRAYWKSVPVALAGCQPQRFAGQVLPSVVGRAVTRHTLIVEGPAGSGTTMELFVDDPVEVWRIGHELFPGSRLAAVNHEDEDETISSARSKASAVLRADAHG
jgi:hypothetical protein